MKKRFRRRLLPFLVIILVIANVINPGLIQPIVVYAAEEPDAPQQGTETPSSIVLGKGTIEINGHLFTNAEFQTFLNNAEIIRVPFEKSSAFALGEYDDLVGNGAETAGGLTILTGAVVGAFQKLTAMFNLADLAESSYVAIGTIGGVTLPLAIRYHSDSIEINDIFINSFNKALVDLTNFFVNHKKANPDEEIVVPDTGSGDVIKPGEVSEADIESAVNNIDNNKKHHILQDKHNWNKLVPDPNDPNKWGKIAGVITTVLSNGTKETYGGVEGVFIKTYQIGEEIVQVTYRIVDGVLNLSDAWVK